MGHSPFISATPLIMRNEHGIEVSPQTRRSAAKKGVML